LTLTSTGAFRFANLFEVTAGIYSALTKQTGSLSSFELRPFVGFRVSSNFEKRWMISNLSRLEFDILIILMQGVMM
jgi:hypothetical protein